MRDWAKRRRRHLYFGVFLLTLDIGLMVASGPLLGGLVFERLRDQILEKTNGQLSFRRFTADFFTGSFQFEGLRFESETARRRMVISAAQGRLDLELGAFFSGEALILDDLMLRAPTIEYEIKTKPNQATPAPLSPGEIQIRALELLDGRASFREPGGSRLLVSSLDLRGWDLSTRDPLALCAHVALSGLLEGSDAPFTLVGSAARLHDTTPKPTENKGAGCRMEGVALPPFSAFLGTGLPFQLESGQLAGELRFLPLPEGGAQMDAELHLFGVSPRLGKGAMAALVAQTGLPQALKARNGNLDLTWSKSLSDEDIHQDAAAFLRNLAETALQLGLQTLASGM
jgi:hypothetical protein